MRKAGSLNSFFKYLWANFFSKAFSRFYFIKRRIFIKLEFIFLKNYKICFLCVCWFELIVCMCMLKAYCHFSFLLFRMEISFFNCWLNCNYIIWIIVFDASLKIISNCPIHRENRDYSDFPIYWWWSIMSPPLLSET